MGFNHHAILPAELRLSQQRLIFMKLRQAQPGAGCAIRCELTPQCGGLARTILFFYFTCFTIL
jgi:hypothetical protein